MVVAVTTVSAGAVMTCSIQSLTSVKNIISASCITSPILWVVNFKDNTVEELASAVGMQILGNVSQELILGYTTRSLSPPDMSVMLLMDAPNCMQLKTNNSILFTPVKFCIPVKSNVNVAELELIVNSEPLTLMFSSTLTRVGMLPSSRKVGSSQVKLLTSLIQTVEPVDLMGVV